MSKPKNYYIRYKRLELENYVNHPESCVKKVHKVEKLIFGSNVVNNFKESILRILSRKIGKYDRNLDGVVLDFRNTKILNMQTGIRYDSAYSVVNIETNFYIFAPRKDVIVDGIVKHINIQKMETIISVVIYRVFNVKVTFKGCIKKNDVHHNKEIKIRIKEFHFDNEIPYIEGEMVGMTSMMINTRKVFDDIPDSGISESSTQNEMRDNDSDNESENYELDQSYIKIKQERESSTEPSTSITSSNRHVKRKMEDNYDLPSSKKVKKEKLSDDDSLHNHITTKHNDSEIDLNDSAKKSKKKKQMNLSNSINEFSSSASSTEKMPKKKKKKKRSAEDDFESSLQMLLDSSITIKKEKE